jgi:hypothetical protein
MLKTEDSPLTQFVIRSFTCFIAGRAAYRSVSSVTKSLVTGALSYCTSHRDSRSWNLGWKDPTMDSREFSNIDTSLFSP